MASFARPSSLRRLVSTVSLASVCCAALACGASKEAPEADAGAKAKEEVKAKEAEVEAEKAGAEQGEPANTGPAPAEAGADVDPPEADAGETEAEEPAGPVPTEFAEIGVALCDQYVKDYLACIEAKVPEDQREALRRVVHENHSSWSRMKDNSPASAQGLQTGCRIAREQAKRETESFGCEW